MTAMKNLKSILEKTEKKKGQLFCTTIKNFTEVRDTDFCSWLKVKQFQSGLSAELFM